jgi:hypothetical protein
MRLLKSFLKASAYKQDTAYMIMLKKLFSKLKGKQDKTSNDVNTYKEYEGKKPEELEK